MGVSVNVAGIVASTGQSSETMLAYGLLLSALLIAAVASDRRPVGHRRRQRRREMLEFPVTMHRLSIDDREDGRDVLNGVLGYNKIIVRQDREIRELALLDLPL